MDLLRGIATALRGTARAREPRHTRDDRGLTLVEVVVASLLLGILASIILAIVLVTQSAQVGNRGRIAAANLAAREIDLVREQFGATTSGPMDVADAGVVTNPHPLDGGTAGDPLVVDGTSYTVVRSAAWNLTGEGVSACEGGTLVSYPTLTVSVRVTWPTMGAIEPVVSHTVLAPDKLSGVDSDDSFVAVLVVDETAAPSAGRTVYVANGGDIRSGLTDSSGCAVVKVEPAGGGTDYTVSVSDPGYVDISNNPAPSKKTGPVERGTINNSVNFSYARAGTVQLRLIDPSGGVLSQADVLGSQATLVASEYSGSTGETVHTVTDVTTTIGNLWPTTYGGYSGTVAPAAGYPTAVVGPGATVLLEVPYAVAQVPFTGLPAGTTGIVAVPAASGSTCSGSDVKTFAAASPSATLELPPGDWRFYLTGTYFACSPGDPDAQTFPAGEAEPVVWNPGSTLAITDAPPGAVWAVDRGIAGSLATCPGGGVAAHAQPISGTTSLLPGDWYLYVTDGAADGACVGFLGGGKNPVNLAHGETKTVGWVLNAVQVTITGVEDVTWGTTPDVLVSTSSSLSCTRFDPGGATNLGQPGWDRSLSPATLAQGTWYVFGWDTRRNGAWSPRCQLAGTVVIGPASGNLTIDYSTSSPRVVGP